MMAPRAEIIGVLSSSAVVGSYTNVVSNPGLALLLPQQDCFSMQVFKEIQRFSGFNGPTPTTGSVPPDGKPPRENNGEVGGRPWRPR